MVTTRPMNHGTALSDSATNSSITNSAANSHFAWRAKCHRNAISPPGGSGFSGAAVGVRNRSKNANICGWLQGLCGKRQSTCQEAGNRPRGASSRWRFLIFKPDSVRVIVMAGKNTKGIAMKRVVGALVALLAFTAAAQAQTYPTRPITMLVGFPPGGPTDTLARIVADAMQPSLGQSVVVETVSGASGTIASGRVVHASPDGYTIGIGNWTSHVGSPALYALDYAIYKDLQPVALLAASPLWIVGKNDLPPKSAPELITWLKARPDPATFGTIGSGSAAHLCGLFFAQKTGVRLQYVPYRGGAPVMQDLIGGQIDLSCLEASQTLANVEAGRFKAYAVMGEQRWE